MTTESASTELVWVLYGSQTGNSQQAAEDFCAAASEKLGSHVNAQHASLDDFLELERCRWSRVVVIITSSYGVGQAPLGCYRFRELCDALTEKYKEDASAPKILDGLTFAMCGLGDSKYTTFFVNPTRIDKGLQAAGAVRVGPLGKADASGSGDELQSKVVDAWLADIWSHLKPLFTEDSKNTIVTPERLAKMQQETADLCRKINPDFEDMGKAAEKAKAAAKDEEDHVDPEIIVYERFLYAVLVACIAVWAYVWAEERGYLS